MPIFRRKIRCNIDFETILNSKQSTHKTMKQSTFFIAIFLALFVFTNCNTQTKSTPDFVEENTQFAVEQQKLQVVE